jgi:hypothetical protein
LILVLERTPGVLDTIAAWELGTEGAIDASPGVAGVEDAIEFMRVYQAQEGPPLTMAVTSVFGRVGAVVAMLNDYAASLVDNDSSVAGATVADALDTLAGLLAGLQASAIANDSSVAGADVAAALDNLAAAILALSEAAGGPLLFGADNVQASTTTRYLPAGYSSTAAPTNVLAYRAPRSGNLRNLRVRHGSPGGNGLAIVYTVTVAGAPTALAVSMASTDSDGSDLADSIPVAAGDLVAIEVTKLLGIGASPMEITATLELTPG